MPFHPDSIRAELSRIHEQAGLYPQEFALLQYLVEAAAAGNAEGVSAKELGPPVFGIDIGMVDGGKKDPLGIVRVTVKKVRDKLADFYAGPGHFDAIRINLPTIPTPADQSRQGRGL